jgi:hypothetical protein
LGQPAIDVTTTGASATSQILDFTVRPPGSLVGHAALGAGETGAGVEKVR